MSLYYACLSEEHPRKLFNLLPLELTTDLFSDPVLTMWQERCTFCSEFQFRKLRFSGFPAEWKSPGQFISVMRDDGYVFDDKYFYCRKFLREMIQENYNPENLVIISEDRTQLLLNQLKPLANEKNLKLNFCSMADPDWLGYFRSKSVGTYEPNKNGIPEFKPVSMDSQCGILIFEISEKHHQASFLELCKELDTTNTTIIVVVPKIFNDLKIVVNLVQAGAVAVLRHNVGFFRKIIRVIDYSAPALLTEQFTIRHSRFS
jgi:hypothetical protein